MSDVKRSRPFREFVEDQMKDPEFRAEYEALEPEFALVRQLLELRLKAGLSQRELADKAGMPQSTIARMESGHPVKLTTFLRIVSAMNAKVKLVLKSPHVVSKHKKVAGGELRA